MSAPVAVVIPTLNAAERIGPTLGCLVEGAGAGLIGQVVIADGGSRDGIAEIADAAGADFVSAETGRGQQLRAGAAAATRPWLLFLHADTVLAGDWIGTVRNHIAHHPEQAGYFRLRFDSTRLAASWVAGWANWRSAWLKLPYGDQALLISRRLYDETGGYPPIPLMEDVAIIRAIGRRRLRALAAAAVTDPARYERDGYMRRGLRNLRTLALYRLGVPPERLVQRYRQ